MNPSADGLPREFPPIPRAVNANRSSACIGAWQTVMLGRVITLCFAAFAFFVVWREFLGPVILSQIFGAQTTGRIIKGESYRLRGSERFRIQFTYHYAGKVVESQDDVDGELRRKYEQGILSPNGPIAIRYLHLPLVRPDAIVQPVWNGAYICLGTFLVIWLTPVFFIARLVWFKPRQMRRLCKFGTPVRGTITMVDHGSKPYPMWVHYTFKDALDQSVDRVQRVYNTEEAQSFKIGDVVTVLTLGRGQSTVYELGLFQIQDVEAWAGRAR